MWNPFKESYSRESYDEQAKKAEKAKKEAAGNPGRNVIRGEFVPGLPAHPLSGEAPTPASFNESNEWVASPEEKQARKEEKKLDKMMGQAHGEALKMNEGE